MTQLGPDNFHLAIAADQASGTITAEAPVNRSMLQQFVATCRMLYFGGTQVPFRVIAINPATGETTEEHIPGCVTCSIGG